MTKLCNKCGIEKDIKEFYKGNAKCKSCKIEYQKEFANSNKDKIREYKKDYHVKNLDSIKEKSSIYYENNKEYIKNKSKIYYENNSEEKIAYQKKYAHDNKEIIKTYKKEYAKTYKNRRNKLTSLRKINDPVFKLKCSITNIIYSCFKNKGFSKKSRTYEILGCSYEDFKLYLENKFEIWMNWKNKGLYNGEFNYG